MKPTRHALLSLSVTVALLAGCASTGTTATGTAKPKAAAISEQVSPTTQASETPTKKTAGGAEPECD